MRKLPKMATKTFVPKTLKLFAIPKESEDSISSDSTTTVGDSYDSREEISN